MVRTKKNKKQNKTKQISQLTPPTIQNNHENHEDHDIVKVIEEDPNEIQFQKDWEKAIEESKNTYITPKKIDSLHRVCPEIPNKQTILSLLSESKTIEISPIIHYQLPEFLNEFNRSCYEYSNNHPDVFQHQFSLDARDHYYEQKNKHQITKLEENKQVNKKIQDSLESTILFLTKQLDQLKIEEQEIIDKLAQLK